jgi:2-isopropylmalate synthase
MSNKKAPFLLESFKVLSGSQVTPTATICLKRNGKVFKEAAIGTGPIDAAYNAIDRITKFKARVVFFKIEGKTRAGPGESLVTIQKRQTLCQGKTKSKDIIEAGILAYLKAVNALIIDGEDDPEDEGR